MTSPAAEALRQSPVFRDLRLEVITLIAAALEPVLVHGGATLFRQGDPGDAAYVVLSGRLRIVREGDAGPVVIREIGRGEVVGEFALLTGEPRSATVVAIRDVDLGRLPAAVFADLMRDHPTIGVALSRTLAGILASGGRTPARRARPSIVALRAVGGAHDLLPFAHDLAAAFARVGRTAVCTVAEARAASGGDAPEPAAAARWLQRVEADHAHLLCVVDDGDATWRDVALRQSDLILDVLPAEALPAVEAEPVRSLGHCRRELVVVRPPDGASPVGTARWMDRHGYAARHHVRVGRPEDLARLARIITGTSVGLALGGGAARGAAHYGVIRALQEAGVPVDEVGGTSMGSFVAAQLAAGMTLEEMVDRLATGWARHHPHRAFTWPVIGAVRAQALEAFLTETFGTLTYEDALIDCFACSANLTTATASVHRRGPVVQGCLASMAVPGIGPAMTMPDGSLHVDGAVVNNLPADELRSGVTIAVSVSDRVPRTSGYPSTPTAWQVLRDRWRDGDDAPYYPGLFETVLESMLLGGARRTEEAFARADLALRPPIAHLGLFDFGKVEEFIAIAYADARERVGPWWAAQTGSAIVSG
ncbi:MAG: cyclic nucleotide-binding and patatin-like phospholipase domain-containing protein [Gemmatimonadota bacterium]|jgi:NTE family protein|nr:cyclic nucleotide-binding and patatin-like phospholipase domain-containing protein [Gemmatimonadota bacterium]MDQ8147633.1 cyclic nucleotide-binding and patatin-like phospholipase domain-containing protein [Gemmatimonadota bacterium]MDQ8149258.1 cyclic nucleotide-binding and patatin-like phospholipase domain-containing protein [Gemmatimonadota bacterium]MDQ8157446.1 cyclic nucleotide-binding and patatin-like phospholipase domain-containing protein [Gemmatimonadota bacterium]MDQ8176861.1 cycl